MADNQAPGPHPRKANGEPELDYTRVAYFLRADRATAPPVPAIPEIRVLTTPPDPDLFPQGDEDTRNLKEPFNDNGEPIK